MRNQLYSLVDFSLGSNDKDDPTLISDKALADVENMVIGVGFVRKRHGYIKYTPAALANAIYKLYTFFKNAGTNEFLAVSNTSLYKDTAGTLSAIPTYQYVVIEDCEDAWDESVDADVTSTLETTIKKTGNGSVKLVVAVGATVGDMLATEAITSLDISTGTHVRLWIRSSVNTASGDLQLLLDNTALCASPVFTLNIPALVADTWTQATIAYTGATAGSNAIISVGLKFAVDIGACTIYIDEIEFRKTTTLTANTTQMLTYKDRDLADVVLIADTGKLKVYDSTAVSVVKPHTVTAPEATDPGLNDLVNLTNFRAIAIKQDRIFALGHATVRNRLSFCHHDPTLGYAVYDYWPATFFFDLVSEQNDEAITIRTFRNAIVVFNKHSMWSLTGDGRTISDYNLNRINVADGLAAPESVCFVGNNIFYLANDDKIYKLFATDQNYISADVISTDPDTRSSVETTIKGISLADKALAVGTFSDNKYWLSFPSGLTLVYDLDLKCWTKYLNIKANSFLNRDGVLYFSTTTGYIYKFDTTVFNDDGAAIATLMKTRKADYGAPVQTKKYRNVWTIAKQYEAESSTFNLSAIIDDITIDVDDISTDESGVWDEGDYDNVTWDFKDVVQKKNSLRKKGRTIQFIITSEVVDEPLTIYQIITQFKLKKPK